MRKIIQNKLKDQKGLTLIELLAVIVILAIIAAIAIPAIGNIINNSRVGAIKSDAQNALVAADLYLIDNPNFFTAPVTDLTMTELSSEYLDDQGSFATSTNFKITKGSTGELLLTATGAKIGGVVIDFAGANKAAINSLKNNTSDEAGTGAVPANTSTPETSSNGIVGLITVKAR